MESHHSSVFVTSYETGIDRVKRGNYAFLMESTMLDYVVQVSKHFYAYSSFLWTFGTLSQPARLQPDPDRGSPRLEGVRNRDAQGLQVEGQTLAGHPRAAGEGHHSDALQQVVEKHRRRLHQTGGLHLVVRKVQE